MERLDLARPYQPVEFAIHSLRYLPLRGAVQKRHVLDIACGEGLGSIMLSRAGAASVTGVDINAAAIDAARARRRSADRIDFVCADAVDYLENVGRGFDVIASVETIEHLPDPQRFLELCRSRLNPGGTLLVSCPNDRFYYGAGRSLNRYHLHAWSFDAFRQMAEAVLGPGNWSLGAPLDGFGLYPLEHLDLTARSYAEALARRRLIAGDLAAAAEGARNALTPDSSLFFIGIWGPARSPRSHAVVIPRHSSYRMGELGNVSPDIALGVERRLGLVHDGDLLPDEIAALGSLLELKYAVTPIRWTGDADALAAEALGGGFDNLHFESPAAFAALAELVTRRARETDAADPEGQAWTAAALSVRRPKTAAPDPVWSFADAIIGGEGVADPVRDVPMFWTQPAPEPAAFAEAVPAPRHRVAVLLPPGPERGEVERSVVPGVAAAAIELHLSVIDESEAEARAAKAIRGSDVLVCLDASGTARRVAAGAIARGLALILPDDHPLVPLLGPRQRPLVGAGVEAERLRRALEGLYGDAGLRAEIRAENLRLAERLASAESGVAWTRTLARAQRSRLDRGRPLREAVLASVRAMAAARTQERVAAAEAECDRLRRECERLQARDAECSRLIADLILRLEQHAQEAAAGRGQGNP